MAQPKSDGAMTPVSQLADGLTASSSRNGRQPHAPANGATTISSAGPSAWFGPQQPLTPLAPPGTGGRAYDYPFGVNLNYNPRTDGEVTFGMLRSLADTLPELRIIIEKRKDQIGGWAWDIQPRMTGKDRRKRVLNDKEQERIDEARLKLARPDRRKPFHSWLRMLLEDMLVIDGACIYPRLTRGGELYSLDVVDGATIKPLIGGDGRQPLPGEGPAWQQILHGVPAADFQLDELLYLPRNSRSNRLYGYSPVEQVVLTINIALRRSIYTLEYYNSGTLPEAFATLPAEWTQEQIATFQEYWDALLAGELGARRKVRFVPGEFTLKEVRQPPLKDQFDEWIVRVICAAFSIPPSAFVNDTNRATAQTIQLTSAQEGVEPLKLWVKSFLDDIIQRLMDMPDLEFVWAGGDNFDPLEQAQVDASDVQNGIRSRDEVRIERGLDPIGVGLTVSGPVFPLVESIQQAIDNINNPPEVDGAPGQAKPAKPTKEKTESKAADEAAMRGPGKSKTDDAAKAASLGASTLYVNRPLLNGAAFVAWAKDQGFATTLPEDDLHVTVAFSKRAFDTTTLTPDDAKIVVAGGKRKLKRFGKAVVLAFEADPLSDRWQEFADAGASWDHDGYTPHITVSYDADDLDIDAMQPFPGQLVLGGEIFAPVNEKWADTITEKAAKA